MHRSRDHKLLGGVLGGIAESWGWRPWILRVAVVLLITVGFQFLGIAVGLPELIQMLAVVAYLIAWWLAPRDLEAEPIAIHVPVSTGARTVPAGWYPDPAGSTDARWFDGQRWTDHLSAAGRRQR